jgi:UDP-glucuronate decarboxylase
VDVRIARLFNTYGPRMAFDDGRVMSSFVHASLTSQPLRIQGDGRQTRSFCFVSDTVSALVALMGATAAAVRGGQPLVQPLNIGNPLEETSVRDLATLVWRTTAAAAHSSGDAAGDPPLLVVDAAVDDPHRRKPDIQRAAERLQWSPRVSLVDGVRLTVADFRARIASAPPVGHNGAAAASVHTRQ